MKRVKSILKWTGIFVGSVAIVFVAAVYAMQNTTYMAPYPAVVASRDSAVIARGRHLATGPAHCNGCHVAPEDIRKAEAGEPVELKGGFTFNLPLGKIRAPNITPDVETGIGGMKDHEIARSLRYGVDHKGQALFDFMPFHNLSDEDLRAVISYLRTLKPVKNHVERRDLNFAGKAVNAFIIKPVGPDGIPPLSVKEDTSAAYGKYLAHSVANCVGCHTMRDMTTGAFVGKPFAGGFMMESEVIRGLVFTTPNITPDPATGRMAHWDEEDFITRFRTGALEEGTTMPWGAYRNMTDDELKALYRYLQTVEPVRNEITQIVTVKD